MGRSGVLARCALRLRTHHVEKSSSSSPTTARVKETRRPVDCGDDDLIKDTNKSLAFDDRAGRDRSFHTNLSLHMRMVVF